MQINNSPRFIQKLMIGLVASSAGAFVALPSVAMPTATTATPDASVEAVEEIEGTPLAAPGSTPAKPANALAEPTAAETLPAAETEAMGEEADESAADTVVEETETLEEAPLVEADELMEEPVAEDDSDLAPVAEDDSETAPVAEDDTNLAPVAEDDTDLAPVAEDDSETAPVADELTDDAEGELAADEMDTEEFTISELTSSSDSFEVLAAALEAADLTEVLGGEGPFTVFAPTDEAFEALPEGAVEQLLLPENKDVLIQVLTYHVVPGAMLSADLETGDIVTVEGSDLAVDVADADTVTVNNANVVFADVAASNGVIHVIDRVVLPPTPEADADIDAPAADVDALETETDDVIETDAEASEAAPAVTQ
jgi:uncharacterized surface protein with fasciclin (FAS1) repeats